MYQRLVKRVLDIALSLLAMPFLLPLLAVLGFAIRLSDGGPAFYGGLRLGKNGRLFKMYKLRSMAVGAPEVRNPDGSSYCGADDPRVTRLGRLLRKTSLDETPQLINVLKGDMSVIGPRPDLPEHLALYTPEETRKLAVRPGVTGYSQAYFRNAAEWKERLRYDVYYAGHVSPFLDARIFMRTLYVVLARKNIYGTPKKGEGREPHV